MKSKEPKEPYVPLDKVPGLKPKVRKQFEALAAEYRDTHDRIKPLEARKKEIGSALCATMMGVSLTRIEVGGLWVRQQDNVNTRIDPKLLLANGVSADIIRKCTVTTRTPYALVQAKPEDNPLVEGA